MRAGMSARDLSRARVRFWNLHAEAASLLQVPTVPTAPRGTDGAGCSSGHLLALPPSIQTLFCCSRHPSKHLKDPKGLSLPFSVQAYSSMLPSPPQCSTS